MTAQRSLPREKKKREEHVSNIWVFQVLSEDWCLSSSSLSFYGTQHTLDAWRLLVCCCFQDLVTADRNRESKRLQPLSLTHRSEVLRPQKRFERSPESLGGLASDGLYFTKPVLKRLVEVVIFSNGWISTQSYKEHKETEKWPIQRQKINLL